MTETNPTIRDWKRRYEHEIIDDAAVKRWSVLTKGRRRRGTRVRDDVSRGTARPKSGPPRH